MTKKELKKHRNLNIFLSIVCNFIYLCPLIVLLTSNKFSKTWVEWSISAIFAVLYVVVVFCNIKYETKKYKRALKLLEQMDSDFKNNKKNKGEIENDNTRNN